MTIEHLRLAGKTALVTGSTRGIGQAIALRLAEEGADVAVTGRHEVEAEVVAARVRRSGRRSLALEVDLTSVAAVEVMIERAVAELGRIDILVNNAGLIRPNPFGSVSESDWDASFELNAKAVFFAMQLAAPHVPDGGTIVNIASIAGRGTATGSPPYAASKAAVINMTQTTARALGSRKIRVNAVCPGFVKTDFQRHLDEDVGQKKLGLPAGELERRWAAGNLLGRAGEPEEVAAAVSFLVGPEAALITGQTLNLDGGVVIY